MKKLLAIVLAVMLTSTLLLLGSSGYKPLAAEETIYGFKVLVMQQYHGGGDGGQGHTSYCCGPSSGVSIGRYYRDEKEYGNLSGDDKMYDELYDCFPTGDSCFTSPYNYGDGFDEMTDRHQYHNFNPVSDGELFGGEVTPDDYNNIVYAIDNGWPVALCGNFWGVGYVYKSGNGPWPYLYGHYVAIKGYKYEKIVSSGEYVYRYIYCTDSYSESDTLILDWADVMTNGSDFTTITIEDNLIEDFEWGKDNDPLNSAQHGDVTWTVTKSGYSKAVIDTMNHHLGTRSGGFYYDGKNFVRAQYSRSPSAYRGFYLRKGSDASFGTTNGNGDYRTCVIIDTTENLKYYDGSYHNVCTVSANTWHLIEFKNMNWGAGTFNIYVDGDLVTPSGAIMLHDHNSGYSGKIAYYADSGKYWFWIDDIYK